jgi:crotonobetainyl-CoA:carnitine CoA-transferase CaiB-like acyl-CoA transferase
VSETIAQASAGTAKDAPPLEGVRVLDFSSLVPGPLATLVLAEAGAEVVKVERPGRGEEMRSYHPRLGDDSANFVVLNRGKQSISVDLKNPEERDELLAQLPSFDVLVEQFRPGVMARLGLGYEQLSARCPRLIYCSITGYGQTGPRAGVAGHDLNYVAEAGLLDQVRVDGAAVLPHALLADIGGGAYPAVINILMALIERSRSGRGRHLDVAMADNVFPFLYWGLAQGHADGSWPRPAADLVTGGSPRYNLYRAADGESIAVAPLEDRFWERFCELIGLDPALRDDANDPQATIAAVAELIAGEPSSVWAERFVEADVCCSVVRSLEVALNDTQFEQRGLFSRRVAPAGADGESKAIPALPVPLDPGLRRPDPLLRSPALDLGDGALT